MKTFQQFLKENSEINIPSYILKAVKIACVSDFDKFINSLRALNNIEITEILDDVNRNNLNRMKNSSSVRQDVVVPNFSDIV